MAISFVAAGAEASGTSGTTVTPALPAGIANDDILIVVADCWDGNAVGSMGADWTRIVELSGNTNYPSFAVFWRRYDGTDPSRTVTFSGSSGDGKIAAICAFRGCKTIGSPFNVTPTSANGTDNTIEHGPLTTDKDGCYLVCLNGTDGSDARTSLASGFTNIFEDTAGGTDNAYRQTEASIHASYKDQGAQGATGTLVVSGSAIPGWASSLLALEPAAAGGVESLAVSGSVSGIGKLGVASSTAHVRSTAAAGHCRVIGQSAFAFASDSKSATSLAGVVAVGGSSAFARASDDKSAFATAGHVDVVGAASEAGATANTRSLTVSGSIAAVGAIGIASFSDKKDTLAISGAISTLGQVGFATTSLAVTAVAGQVQIVGLQNRATTDTSARAVAGEISITPAVGVAVLDTLAIAASGNINASGNQPTAVASDAKLSLAISGDIGVAGSQPLAAVSDHKWAIAVSGSLTVSGAGGVALSSDKKNAIASPGTIFTLGHLGFAVNDARAQAGSGHTLLIGQDALASAPDNQTTFALSGTVSMAGGQPIAVASDAKLAQAIAGGVGTVGEYPHVVASDNTQAAVLSGFCSIAGQAGVAIAPGPVALSAAGSISLSTSVGIAAVTTGIGAGPTTLDPASVTSGGSLSGGNLTLSAPGSWAYAASTRAATGKQTVQVTTSGANGGIAEFGSSSTAYDGFRFARGASNWILYRSSDWAVIATGSSSPSPTTADVFTLDVDVPNKRVSARVNGTTVLSNIDVSAYSPSVWKFVVVAGKRSAFDLEFSSTVKFSGLTYAPLAGFTAWDTAGVASALSGGAEVSGAAGQATATVHARALATSAGVHVAGTAAFAFASNPQEAFAEAGQISIAGAESIAIASDHKSAISAAGAAVVAGSIAYVAIGKNAFAAAGSVKITGPIGFSWVDSIVVSAPNGNVVVVGEPGVGDVTRHARALATVGRIDAAGSSARAFSLMSVLPRERTAVVPGENLVSRVAPERRAANVSSDTPQDRSANVPWERRTSIVVGDRDSQAAPERRNAVA